MTNVHYRCYIPNMLHKSTPRSADQHPTQMSYEKRLRIQKECSQPYDFCRAADTSAGDISCSISIIEL